MSIEEALGKFLLQLEADGRSRHTVDQYARHIRLLVGPKNPIRALQHPFRRAFSHPTVSRLARPDTARMIPGCRISLCL